MLNRNPPTRTIALLACSVMMAATARVAPAQGQPSQLPSAAPLNDRALAQALCPIVYPVDRVPSSRGYRYLFYGNAFFINKDGYLLTAAHVLSQLHGGQPYLLLRTSTAAPKFVRATVVAVDRDHDVAILLATANPFASTDTVSFLPLARQSPTPGRTLLLAALRPFQPREAYTLEPAFEERSAGEMLGFEFSQLEKGRADTEVFLFNHVVGSGQSGAPVISLDSKEVVGLVEGQWLRESPAALAALDDLPKRRSATPSAASEVVPIPGAVIPIHYAIALLQQNSVDWRTASGNVPETEQGGQEGETFVPPAPLSLVPAPYPSQSLFGGEVVLDALVGRSGMTSEVKVISGNEPLLTKALAAVRTWTFLPARSSGHLVEARIAIAFEFPQPYVPPRSSTVHHYDEDSWAAAQDSAALPLTTVEPKYPSAFSTEGSVILYESIDHQGHVRSVQTLRGVEPLTAATVAAANQWRFTPAKRSGTAVDSAAIVVVTFRRPLVSLHIPLSAKGPRVAAGM
jgi:outer membrane biosynthesis protein TonB